MSQNKIQLKSATGEVIAELPMYRSLYEVPLNRYIDFLKAREPLDNEEKLNAGEVNIPRVLAKSVGAFFGLDLDKVLRAKYGEYHEGQDLDGGLQSLYVWVVQMVGTFQAKMRTPEDCSFVYQGGTYKIPAIGFQALNSLPLLPPLDTGSAIEAYEIRRVSMRQIEKEDPEGSFLFSYYLQLLAVLCRKDGEKFPVSEGETEAYINDRALMFQNIDAGTALDVDFFLWNMMPPSAKTLVAVGSLSAHAFAIAVVHAKLQGLNKTLSTERKNTQSAYLKKLGGVKSISKSLNGGGSRRRVKVPSKR